MAMRQSVPNHPVEDRLGDLPGSRRGCVLIAMCISLVLVVASVSSLNLALPELALNLRASSTSLTWIADGYTIALAACCSRSEHSATGSAGATCCYRHVVFGVAALSASFAGSTGRLIMCRVCHGRRRRDDHAEHVCRQSRRCSPLISGRGQSAVWFGVRRVAGRRVPLPPGRRRTPRGLGLAVDVRRHRRTRWRVVRRRAGVDAEHLRPRARAHSTSRAARLSALGIGCGSCSGSSRVPRGVGRT